MGTTLIFPAVTPEAAAYFRQLAKEGRIAIAAASVVFEEDKYGKCTFLPSVNSPEFGPAFLGLLQNENITEIFSPVASVHVFLSEFLSKRKLPVRLVNDSPISVQVAHYHDILDCAQKLEPFEKLLANGKSRLSRHAIAAILRQSQMIYGESNEEKIAAMMGIFATAIKGDVVEIGSLMGRTAAVLRLLAQRYATGSVLTVDPWDAAEGVQHDSPEFIQSMSCSWEPGLIAQGFRVNMLGMGGQDFFHLCLPSLEACDVYAQRPLFEDSDFSGFRPSGRISVLHIDANHDFDAVKSDLEKWGSFLVPGSWLILDDYEWLHGNGPQRVGDAWITQRLNEIDIAFVCGKALFIHLIG